MDAPYLSARSRSVLSTVDLRLAMLAERVAMTHPIAIMLGHDRASEGHEAYPSETFTWRCLEDAPEVEDLFRTEAGAMGLDVEVTSSSVSLK